MKKILPNLFTLLNLSFGFVAIICFLGDEQRVLYLNEDNTLEVRFFSSPIIIGTIFIFLAGIVDILDGWIARILRATSILGKELDSLSDVVSFGIAPGILLYKMLKISFAAHFFSVSIIYFFPVLFFPCAIAYRLARFNVDDEQIKIFKGMPAPAAGILVAGLPWATYLPQNILEFIYYPFVLYGIIIVLSYFIISKYPMMSLKMGGLFNFKKSWSIYLLILIGLCSTIYFSMISFLPINALGISVMLFSYIILSLIVKPKINKKN